MDLKYPNSDRLARVARWLASPEAMEHFADFFGPTVDLVPAPGHAPLGPSVLDRVSSAGELVAALVRTRSDLEQVEAPLELVSDGRITLESSGQTRRTP